MNLTHVRIGFMIKLHIWWWDSIFGLFWFITKLELIQSMNLVYRSWELGPHKSLFLVHDKSSAYDESSIFNSWDFSWILIPRFPWSMFHVSCLSLGLGHLDDMGFITLGLIFFGLDGFMGRVLFVDQIELGFICGLR